MMPLHNNNNNTVYFVHISAMEQSRNDRLSNQIAPNESVILCASSGFIYPGTCKTSLLSVPTDGSLSHQEACFLNAELSIEVARVSYPLCCSFKSWAYVLTPHRLSSLSCINEYLKGCSGNVIE